MKLHQLCLELMPESSKLLSLNEEISFSQHSWSEIFIFQMRKSSVSKEKDQINNVIGYRFSQGPLAPPVCV